ncbi:MAG TPA: hypothetical protein VGO07_03265 [Candidatus Saccharimonadales bacterium]|jgi:hypothetical protein|nr:hypothetical protein [Candidatus Saccharimonadales bacterium]
MTRPRVARLLLLTLCGLFFTMGLQGTASAACSAELPKDKGQDTLLLKVAKDGTYRVWARVYAPNGEADAFLIRVDDTYCAITVGNSGKLSPKALTWVNYQDGDTAKPIDIALTAGDHTVVMAGVEAGVGIDRLLFLTDRTCVPTGNGDNCGDVTEVTLAGPFAAIGNSGTAISVPAGVKGKSHTGQHIALAAIAGAAVLIAVVGGIWWYRRNAWRSPKLWSKR